MTHQYPQPPQHPMVLGGARNAQHVPLEERQRHQRALRQWQDQQADDLKRRAAKARIKGVAVTALGSFLILAFLWVQMQAGRIDPPELILVPTALAVILIALAAILPPWRDVAKALRQHRKNRRAESRARR